MSLTGNLEDLPLLDILQVVSFSKKTGFLSIEAEIGRGAIVFDSGFVVAAFTWETPPLDARARTLEPGRRDVVLRGRIEMALEQLIRLREGLFNFSLTDRAPFEVAGRDIEFELLSQGIDAQELLLDLARGMNEDRRKSTATVLASFAETGMDAGMAALLEPPPSHLEPPLPPPHHEESPATAPATVEAPAAAPPLHPGPAPGALRTILLVDDEAEVRLALAGHFSRAGYTVVEAEDPDGAVKRGRALAQSGALFLLVIDLGMPTADGTSFQGGLEAVKKLAKANVKPPVLLMTESLTAAVQTRAKEMGIKSFVFKPSLSKLDPEQFEADLEAFAAKILADVLPRLSRPQATPAEEAPAMAPPIRAAAPPGPPAPAAPAPTADQLSRELAMLGQRLDDLRRPQDTTQIGALVMSVAAEFFERSVLFLVKNDELRGVHGFGPTVGGNALNLLARDLVIPLSERSIFSDVVIERRGFTGSLPVSALTTTLLDRIGRLQGGDAALLPLVTQRETIALLYGDNPGSGRPPGRLDGLRLFINQAGIALENATLHRKAHVLTGVA